jgi:hypothetical protein
MAGPEPWISLFGGDQTYCIADDRRTAASHIYTNVIDENCLIVENNVIQPFARLGERVMMWSGNQRGAQAGCSLLPIQSVRPSQVRGQVLVNVSPRKTTGHMLPPTGRLPHERRLSKMSHLSRLIQTMLEVCWTGT